VQLSWRLRALIASGRLQPGARMPSVRSLADWAEVNVNTVRGVYAKLEQDGLVTTRHGSGSFVAEGASGSSEVERIVADAMAAADEAGVDPHDVAIVAAVASSLAEIEAEPGGDDFGRQEEIAAELELDDSWLEVDAGAARRELRRQIGRLESELAGYRHDLEPGDVNAPIRPREPRIAGVEALAQSRDGLVAQLADARAAAAARSRRERRARRVRDEIVADPASHPWEVVSAAETGEPGCTTWSARPRMGPLGVLMSWWRVKVSGGCPRPRPGGSELLPGSAEGHGRGDR